MALWVERDQLIQGHVSALATLGTRYQRELFSFLNVAKKEPTNQLSGFIGRYLPQLNAPFQSGAQQIGQQFINLRAQQSGVDKPTDVRDVEAYRERLDVLNARATALMEKLVIQQRQGYKTADVDILKAMERPIVEADRAVTLTLSLDTKEVPQFVVGVRSTGCAFCKMMSVGGALGRSGDDADFHNNCRCVFDAQFDDDPGFEQSFAKEMKQRYEAAQERIANGEVGDKVLSTRSKAWEAEQRKNLANHLREERKVWEEDLTPSKAERAERRKQDAKEIDSIMERVMTGDPLAPEQAAKLKKPDYADPFDTELLYKPIHKPYQPTHRDTVRLIQSEDAKEIYDLNKKLAQS